LSIVFAGFPVAEVERVVRRTIYVAIGLAVVALGASVALGYLLVGIGVVIGLGLGVLNNRLFTASATHVTTSEGTLQKKPFALSVFARLGLVTVVAIGLMILVRQLGWGIIVGLVAFQLVLMVVALRAVLRYQREEPGAADA
jgi:O-antigen/teichoic acid export membrane protein